MSGKKIIDGLRDAVRGNMSRVLIDGQTWVRCDAGSPEDLLVAARQKIAELTTEIDVLRAKLDDIEERGRDYPI